MTKIALVNGRVIDPADALDAVTNIYVAEGKIQSIGSNPADFTPDVIVDAKHQIIAPGIVDLNANVLQSMGELSAFTQYTDLAVKCGITSFATSTMLGNRCLELTEFTALSRSSPSGAKSYFVGPLMHNLQGKQLAELALLQQAGCVAFSNGLQPILNSLIKHRCYDYASMLGLKIFILPQDPFLSEYGCMHEGQVSTRLGLPGIPVLAESLALAQEILQIEAVGVSAHIARVSCADSIGLLKSAQIKGLLVTADVAIHQLYLTDVDVALDNGLCHVQPPLRSNSDKNSLRDAIKKDIVSIITSDHITLAAETKARPFQDTECGIASWPVLLPLVLRLANEEKIPLTKILACITSSPAKTLGIDAGHLKLGSRANIMVFDPEEHWALSENELASYGYNTPFANWQLKGRIKTMLVDGQIVFHHDR